MKRIGCLLLCLVLLCACGQTRKADVSRLEIADHADLTVDERITLTMDYPEYALDDTEIYWILDNEAEESVVAVQSMLEYQEGDTWYTIPVREDVGIVRVRQDPQGSGMRTSGRLPRDIYDFSFPKGHYRIAFTYLLAGPKVLSGTETADHVAYAEFDLVEKAKRVQYQQFVEQLYDIEPSLDNGLVILSDTVKGQENVDRFLNRSLSGVPAEMRVIDTEADVQQHFYYKDGCWTVQEYKNRAVTTISYSHLYFDPEIEEIYLSNYQDPVWAKAEGFMVDEPEDVFQIGPTTEENVRYLQKVQAAQTDTEQAFLQVPLYGPEHGIGLVSEEDGIYLIVKNEGLKMLEPGYHADGAHPVGIRPLSETAGIVFFAGPDGQTEQRILDVTTGEWKE